VAQHDLAAQELERAERLRGTNSQSEYDEAVANEKIALADLAIAQARLEQAKISLKQSDINLDYSTIRSPIDGIVIDRRVNVGQTVVAGLNAPSLFLLARDLSRLQVWAAVNEADIGQVTIGQSVTFRVDAYREAEFAGQVSQIRLNASTSHNVVTYGVIVDIDNTDGKLLPFMTANLQFEVSRKPNVMLVPNQALRWKPELHEVSPVFRQRFTEKNEGLGAASHENTSTNDGNDDDSSSADAEGQTVQVDEPTLWVKHDDGLLKPIPVEIGMSDGVQTEIVAGDVQELTKVAVATIQEKRRDFVSSFVSRVTE
jgi:HlyD family secretion protein